MNAPVMVLPVVKNPAPLPITDGEVQQPVVDPTPSADKPSDTPLEAPKAPETAAPEVKPAEELKPLSNIGQLPSLKLSRFRDCVPSHWHLVPAQDNLIEAYNSRSQERFVGEMADFNQMLRG